MKNFYTSLIAVLFILPATLAQQAVEISWSEDYSVPYNGDEVTLTGAGSSISTQFYVKNLGGDATFVWRRDVLDISSQGFSDQLCDDQICYTTSGNPWICPGPLMIAENDSSLFEPKLLTGGYAGTAHFRYYVLDENENKLDSLDVKFSSTADLEASEKATFKLFPNPTKNNVTLENLSGDYIKVSIVDALGKRVLTQSINQGNEILSVADLKNGIYFVRLEQNDGTLTAPQKLIVKQ